MRTPGKGGIFKYIRMEDIAERETEKLVENRERCTLVPPLFCSLARHTADAHVTFSPSRKPLGRFGAAASPTHAILKRRRVFIHSKKSSRVEKGEREGGILLPARYPERPRPRAPCHIYSDIKEIQKENIRSIKEGKKLVRPTFQSESRGLLL